MKRAFLYRVTGRVQGVGFRYFVVKEAQKLEISGYVKNLSDGSVEVYVIGEDKELLMIESKLKSGPLGAKVTDLTKREVAIDPSYQKFVVTY